MTTAEFEKEVLQYLRTLPIETWREVLDFIKFLTQKKGNGLPDNLTQELQRLSRQEAAHLEEEFRDYKKLYPRDN